MKREISDKNHLNQPLMRERFDVSDRAGAAIASVVLKDFGVIGNDNFAEVIDSFIFR